MKQDRGKMVFDVAKQMAFDAFPCFVTEVSPPPQVSVCEDLALIPIWF